MEPPVAIIHGVRNGAEEARARRCWSLVKRNFSGLSTVLLTQQQTGGGTGTRCPVSRWWVSEQGFSLPLRQHKKFGKSSNTHLFLRVRQMIPRNFLCQRGYAMIALLSAPAFHLFAESLQIGAVIGCDCAPTAPALFGPLAFASSSA